MNNARPERTAAATARWSHGLWFTLFHIIPIFLQGLFTRNRFWVAIFSAVHPDRLSVRFLTRLRKHYGAEQIFIRVGRTTMLLVTDVDSIRRVLDHSPELYADPQPKREGMSRFQPGALTVSRGAAWRNRRQFNEGVLNSPSAIHQYAGPFLQIIAVEVARITGDQRTLCWKHFEQMFERISLGIIFGRGSRDDIYLTRTLHRLMRNGNRAALRAPQVKLLKEFNEAIRGHLRSPEEGSLVALCGKAPSDGLTQVENQIPHWLFAMNETLAANTARAFALVASHPRVQAQLKDSLARAQLTDPAELQQQDLLEGCLQEAMRLWPTTPMLMREALRDDILGATTVHAGTRVVIFNNFNHRDRQNVASADEFSPQRWAGGQLDYRLNHLSNGAQICAGKYLALFIGKAVLANLLAVAAYQLQRPRLKPHRRLPWAYNYYRLRCRAIH